MLRLIDIILIILFGFLMITSIDDQIEVDLVDTNFLKEMSEEKRGYLMVGLDRGSNFIFDYGKVVLHRSEREKMVEFLQKEKEDLMAENRARFQEMGVEPQVRIWADSLALSGDIDFIISVCREVDIECGLLTRMWEGAQ